MVRNMHCKLESNVECCSHWSLVFELTLTKLNWICCADILFLHNWIILIILFIFANLPKMKALNIDILCAQMWVLEFLYMYLLNTYIYQKRYNLSFQEVLVRQWNFAKFLILLWWCDLPRHPIYFPSHITLLRMIFQKCNCGIICNPKNSGEIGSVRSVSLSLIPTT